VHGALVRLLSDQAVSGSSATVLETIRLVRPAAADLPGPIGGAQIPVALPVLRVDEAFDEPVTLRGPNLPARVRPFIGKLN
jgi:hypothetical protein